ncbi:MAG TPA: D-arabinono-1,4-lactone oxidase [Rhizomicrobium sp.]|jgi:FAD-linked oxidoreductase|nr:D-arabinono-1,4-lactone oxidase [Rhizomicrobium sp.]
MKIVGGKWSNWSGGVSCKPKQVVAPKDEVELAAAVRSAQGTVRVPGTGHSFTPICASDGMMIDVSAFDGLEDFDAEKQIATLGAATPIWAIGPLLTPHGVGLKNQGDIDRQMLGGVVGTGTHGTGGTLGSMSAEVAGFRAIAAGGEVIHCSKNENADLLDAGRVSLGMLGVMTEISVHVRPAYKLEEKQFLLPVEEVFAKLDTLLRDNKHFEFFWFPYADKILCKTLNETDKPAREPRTLEEMRAKGEQTDPSESAFAFFNEVLPYAPFLLGPLHRMFTNLMPGKDKVRWSHEIYPSPRTVRFNEMEYAVPAEKGADCVREVAETIRKKRINTGFPIEFRNVAADGGWLSPFYQRASATIAVHQYHRVDTAPLFDTCEGIFRKYKGRPHWGKRHTVKAAEAQALYPKYGEFLALRRKLDPKGKFLNSHLRAIFE